MKALSHVQFADDTIMFSKADLIKARRFNYILKMYCNALGQKVNLHKSGVLFSTHTPSSQRQQIIVELAIVESNAISKYLGVPSKCGKTKT